MRSTSVLLLVLATLLVAGCAGAPDGDRPTTTTPASSPSTPPVLREDVQTFTLGPNQDIEWKYRLDGGASMDYSWSASRPVRFDFHGDHDDGSDAFVSHRKGTLASDADTFTAPFTGRHGWYFHNGNAQTVTIQLEAKGDFEVVGRTGGNAP